ncbi:immunoglobulin-like domain-containing protein [Cellulosimicrobium protaetiae]|uniref:Family 43 glycosylhydrolase n=1 Tax=Cellulosimicrobium protaetiae TaxID=2587808 RepID=A0A6M5UP77_9MICO|nr:immunoglobulin-like domain-containing protein [Cellulosimicrobium protaetiae]QJW38729.1 family 43 glycosylhydrolase [Cellulosimicrobium protaetiae]
MTRTTRSRRPLAALALLPLLACTLPAVAAPASAIDGTTDGLLVAYDFSEVGGTVLHDVADAGGNQHGTVTGGAAWRNGAMTFTGSNYVTLPDALLAGRTDATVVVEALPSASTLTSSAFLWNLGGSGNDRTGQFFVHTQGHRASISPTNYAAEQTAQAPQPFAADRWQSITASISANDDGATSTLSLFVDGVQVAQKTNSTVGLDDLRTHTKNLIGASAYSGDAKFTGAISSFRVYDRALSAAEITDLAAADAATSAQETLAGIDLGDTSAVSQDLDLPTSGGVTWTTSNAGVVEADGTIHRIETSSQDATLTATVDVRGETAQRMFPVTVAALPPAAERAAADLDAVALIGLDDVRDHLALPLTGEEYGSAITWSAEPAGVVSTEREGERAPGFVTRPAFGDPDVEVVLTAHAEGTDVVRTFDATVKALPAPEDPSAYLFAHFTAGRSPNVSNEQIYFATSEDGTSWTDLNDEKPVLTSTVGETGARDPFLVRAPGGDKFYLLATDLSTAKYGWHFTPDNPGSKSLVVWESTDLVNWSAPRLADVASRIPNAGAAWAPEATYDPATGEYMVYWATISGAPADHPLGNTLGDPMNMYYATTRDFVTFSDPVKWIDRQTSIIDTTMLEVDGVFYRASGDGQITIERSTDPYAVTISPGAMEENPGGWERVSTLRDIFGNDGYSGNRLEGPELFAYNPEDWQTDGSGAKVPTWGLIADRYNSGQGYMPFRSTDLAGDSPLSAGGAWSVGDDIDFGAVLKRHGTILPITQNEHDRLQRAYGDAPALTVTATTRCVAGKNVVAATITNEGEAAATVSVSSSYGERTGVVIGAGASKTQTFSTRLAEVSAGSVSVSVDDGGAVVEATYQASHCG